MLNLLLPSSVEGPTGLTVAPPRIALTLEWAHRACFRMAPVTVMHSCTTRATGSRATATGGGGRTADCSVESIMVRSAAKGWGEWVRGCRDCEGIRVGVFVPEPPRLGTRTEDGSEVVAVMMAHMSSQLLYYSLEESCRVLQRRGTACLLATLLSLPGDDGQAVKALGELLGIVPPAAGHHDFGRSLWWRARDVCKRCQCGVLRCGSQANPSFVDQPALIKAAADLLTDIHAVL